ncbi:unnamed protein product [Phytophthora lilii]|uniref:Unnamed protein product n=1 Tax=Phytophthora lilii TaxID=2077276 RepID=A0A9W6WSD8_9STRA|nr:unnamed protein product [Phytophthora lilii]
MAAFDILPASRLDALLVVVSALAALPISSIVTSVLVIVAAFERLKIGGCVVMTVALVAFITLAGGNILLYLLHTAGCDTTNGFGGAASCEHSVGVVVAVLTGISVLSIMIACILASNLKKGRKHRGEEVQDDCEAGQFSLLESSDIAFTTSPCVALMTRLNALSKAAVVAAYWFFVDADMIGGLVT